MTMPRFHIIALSFVLCTASMLSGSLLYADNKVLGELQFEGATNVERGSGVWVDGQYLGYLKELKGSKTVLLLPGEHEVVVRQAGYKDFSQRVTLQPGDKRLIQVTLQKDPRLQMPAVTAEIKLSVDPDRAAVFVDGMFAGHAGELGGVGEGLLVAPGKRKITISLPGYRNFETEVELAPNQKFEIKTKLIKVGASQE
jgi:PEGA domain-containing protein